MVIKKKAAKWRSVDRKCVQVKANYADGPAEWAGLDLP